MQPLRNLSLFILLLMGTLGLRAQNGNAVISEVKAYDLGNGTARLEVRISGNLAYTVQGGTFSVTGDRIPGGTAGGGIGDASRVFVAPAPTGNGNSNGNQAVVIAGLFPVMASAGNGPDFVTVDITVVSRHVGESDRYITKASHVNLWVAP